MRCCSDLSSGGDGEYCCGNGKEMLVPILFLLSSG